MRPSLTLYEYNYKISTNFGCLYETFNHSRRQE